MRVIIQRVTEASVYIDNNIVDAIKNGLLVYLGIGKDDTKETALFIANKLAHLRIFCDENNKLNQTVQDVNGEILLISNFTLYGDIRKGRRPSFSASADGQIAKPLYLEVIKQLKQYDIKLALGQFGANMKVTSTNDGPINLTLSYPNSL
jgi:D-tyrosyl-tRNA(Tyr) deacylase